MKKSTKVLIAVVLLGFVFWKCSTHHSANVKTAYLPTDVFKSCTIGKDTFRSWFAGDSISLNGMVTPANSVKFNPVNNCAFYQWAERMFLWVTSPDSGSHVMESSEFYNVSPPDANGNRQLIFHKLGTPFQMTSHLLKTGPDRLSVVRADNGKVYEIEPAEPKVKEMVKDVAGTSIEIDHVIAGVGHTFTFVDKTGKAIAHPHPIIRHTAARMPIVHIYKAGKKFVLLDAAGNVIESEEGQATGDALIAQNGSLVYYLVLVNDTYAAYLNLAKTVPAFRNKFPTTALERDAIVAYAKFNHIRISNPNTLAMEMKSSWVEASTLGADSSNYVLVTATIPAYTKTDSTWVPIANSSRTVRMALVGMHIVGSAAGHPEMIWSTFEHQNNTPNAQYSYLDSTGKVTLTQPQDSGSHWVFSNNGLDTAFNHSHITTNDPKVNNGPNTDTLFAQPGKTVSASNTLRTMPFGGAADSLVNQQDKSAAASNSEIISINNEVRGLLKPGDVRANYLLIGATWTDGGAPPNQISYGSDTTHGVAIGTSVLANSTMETYIQSTSTSCFTCHSMNGKVPTLKPDTISHIFTGIQKFAIILKPLSPGPKKKQ